MKLREWGMHSKYVKGLNHLTKVILRVGKYLALSINDGRQLLNQAESPSHKYLL